MQILKNGGKRALAMLMTLALLMTLVPMTMMTVSAGGGATPTTLTGTIDGGNGTLTSLNENNGPATQSSLNSNEWEVASGTSIKFMADPDDGYVVEKWTVGGEVATGNTSNTLTWTNTTGIANITVTVKFIEHTDHTWGDPNQTKCTICDKTHTHDTNGEYATPTELGHWNLCEECGYDSNPTSTGHTYSYTKVDSTNHTATCACGYTKTEAHNWNATTGKCNNCDETHNHTYGNYTATASGHSRTCPADTGCGHVETEAHTGDEFVASSTSMNHYKVCEKCSEHYDVTPCTTTEAQKDNTHHWTKCIVCTNITEKIEHIWNESTDCADCDATHEHTNSADETVPCTVCGYVTTGGGDEPCETHDWAYEDGKCKVCEETHEHVADENELCEECGYDMSTEPTLITCAMCGGNLAEGDEDKCSSCVNFLATIQEKLDAKGWVVNTDKEYDYSSSEDYGNGAYIKTDSNSIGTETSITDLFGDGATAKNPDGTDYVQGENKLGTGSIISIPPDKEILIVITNDVTGDGDADIDDAQKYLDSLVGSDNLNRPQELAVDQYENSGSALEKIRDFLNDIFK